MIYRLQKIQYHAALLNMGLKFSLTLTDDTSILKMSAGMQFDSYIWTI